MSRIEDGKFVIIQRGDQQRIIQFMSQQTIAYGRGQAQQDILLKNALNQEYYTAFKVVSTDDRPQGENSTNRSRPGGNKQTKKYFALEKAAEPAAKSFSQLFEVPSSLPSGKDNRNICDDRTSQPLGQSDIYSLRDQGLSSKEIVDTLITSSKSFTQKTEFSQEKYLKKKEKIYGDTLLFLKIDLFLLSEFLFKKDPSRILGLRPDTISQILSYSNVHSGGRYVVYETAGGILVSGMLQRLGGLGVLLHCHLGTNPQKFALNYMNFDEEILKPLRNLDVFYLIKGRGKKLVTQTSSSSSSNNGKEENSTEGSSEIKMEEEDVSPEAKRIKLSTEEDAIEKATEEESNGASRVDKADGVSEPPVEKIKTSVGREENEKSMELLNSGFDGLVICGKEHPLSILQRLLPHLCLSCPFVVYCAYSEPLVDCYVWIKEKGLGANMHIVDNWLRNIQVESERTHPEINMSSGGGYLLYGTHVRNND